MIHVFHNNDPLADDQGGGAEHFRGLFRALCRSKLPFCLVGSRLQAGRSDPRVVYVAGSSNFLRYYLGLMIWFWRNRNGFAEGDVFHFHRNYAAWPKYLALGRRGRTVISYHNVTGKVLEHTFGLIGRPLRWLMIVAERRAVALADSIICVSERDRQALRRLIFRNSFAKTRVIPAAYDAGIFSGRAVARPGIEQAHDILVLGRLVAQKNMPLAIATLEHLCAGGDDYRLTIAGDGADREAIKARIAASPVAGRITNLGLIPHSAVAECMASHGIILVTSRFEASPTVVKEAIAAMRPVVSTDVGDVACWIREARNGFICADTAASLADGVRAASRLVIDGAYNQAIDRESFSEEGIMDRVIDVYRNLVPA